MTRPRAVLVGVLVPGRDPADMEASLDELGRLVDTLGMDTVGRIIQRRSGLGAPRVLGEGKLRELAAWTGGTGVVHRGPPKQGRDEDVEEYEDEEDDASDLDLGDQEAADVVVVDHELSPSQLRNLKSASGVEVLDRNGVIIEIFAGRAHTREARLQVELARLSYLVPRLRELGGFSERQRGGIGGKGAGETGIELDRRRIRDRMAELRRELIAIEEGRTSLRDRRQETRQVALVGYTNAGKSSLMRALTGAEPYVADQLFATLDTTVRRLSPEVTPAILVTDTVGFIKDLPHSLVASFRSTLDAAIDAGLLLHIVDAADASWPQQEAVTASVLAEIGAHELPRVLVFNKCDRLEPAAEAALREARPDAWFTSAHTPARIADLHERISAHFAAKDLEFDLVVPWAYSAVMGLVHAEATVLDERFEDDGAHYRLRAPVAISAKLRAAVGG